MPAPHRLSGRLAFRSFAFLACLALGVIAPGAHGLLADARAEGEGDPPPAPVRAEDPPARPSEWPEGSVLGVVTGQRVNLRVGPRRDNHAVTQVDEGAVVVVVERAADWLGVRVLGGFPVALSAKYAKPIGDSALRIDATNLNLRVQPPEEGKPLPAAFRDHPTDGEVLAYISEDDGWYWALAPEHVRAYIRKDFVREVGAPAEHPELVARGRRERDERIGALVRSQRRASIQGASGALREAIGAAQQGLYRQRVDDGFDRAPVAELADDLAAAMGEFRMAEAGVQKLAQILHADLEAEIARRLARHDAELARLRGLVTDEVPALTPRLERVEVRGKIRWEAAPKWRNGGAFILWIDDEPRYVLQLTTGLKGPLPDLAGSADGEPRTVVARQPGSRVFGLPALDVLSLR